VFERGIEGRQSETLGTPGWTLFKLHAARKDATIFWGIVPLLGHSPTFGRLEGIVVVHSARIFTNKYPIRILSWAITYNTC